MRRIGSKLHFCNDDDTGDNDPCVRYMQNREPFQIRGLMLAYNLFQTVFSAWMFKEVRMMMMIMMMMMVTMMMMLRAGTST